MASPRRALAPLDANKPAPSPVKTKLAAALLPAPALASPAAARERKRALEAEERVVKRSCTDAASPRSMTRQSISPDASAVFEDSARAPVFEDATRTPSALDADSTRTSVFEDATRTTSVFDPDSTRTTASSLEDQQRAQARKMAGDLLARLRLAKYKVRTGQAHVPFPQLEARAPRPEARPSPPAATNTDHNERGAAAERRRTRLPVAPGDGVRGAASLLSLSQGS